MPIIVQPVDAAGVPIVDENPPVAFLGTSGIVFNGDPDAEGCVWEWSAEATVMGGKPGPREETGDRPHADGQWDATRYYGPRNRTIEGEVTAPSHAALHRAEQRLKDALSLSLFDLTLLEPGVDGLWVQRVRQSGEPLWSEKGTNPPIASFSIGLYAPDPLTYDAAGPTTAAVGFPSTTGGLTVPFTVPFSLSSTTVSGRVRLSNPGELELPLVFTLTGPVGDAAIANPDTGQVLHLVNPDGSLLDTGQTLVVDTGRHTARLNGEASRRSWVWGDWLTLPSGNTTLALSGSAGAAASLSIGYTAARL